MNLIARPVLPLVTLVIGLFTAMGVASHPADLSLPMVRAAASGDLETVRIMLLDGVSADAHDDSGIPVLAVAAVTGHPDIIEVLVEFGVDIDAKDAVGGGTALHWAAASGQVEAVRELLAAGADATIRDDLGEDPAAVTEYSEIRRMLQEARPKYLSAFTLTLLDSYETSTSVNSVHVSADGVI